MITKSYFPSQVVSDVEKMSYDYGLKVAKAIEAEWFHTERGSNRYKNNHNNSTIALSTSLISTVLLVFP